MQTILITGGAGFIGSAVSRRLLELGYDVIIYDYRTDLQSISDIEDDIQLVTADIRDLESLRRAIPSVDGVIHLAAVSRVVWGYENPKECVDTNVGGTVNVLEAARMAVRKPWVVFGSSREVYGEPVELPVVESAPKLIKNIYGATKIAGENLCEQYHANYGTRVGVLRFSNVYGGRYDQLDRVIPKFIRRAKANLDLFIQGGRQVFDFTHISDTVAAIVKLIETIGVTDSYFDDFHVLTGKPTSLVDLSELILSRIETTSQIRYVEGRPYDVEKFYGDPSKAAERLSFEAEVDITEGVEATIPLL